jgi:hypothetical protein
MWVLPRTGLAVGRACERSQAWALGRNVYGVVGDGEGEWVLKGREVRGCEWDGRGQRGELRDGVYA